MGKQWNDTYGFKYINNFLSQENILKLKDIINSNEWNESLDISRQFYGYEYSVKNLINNRHDILTETSKIPKFFLKFFLKFKKFENTFDEIDQIMINKYKENYNLYAHVDNIMLYNNIIYIYTLKGNCVLRFRNFKNAIIKDINIEQNSLYIMKNKSRYDFTHEIIESPKERISIVFRSLKKNLNQKT